MKYRELGTNDILTQGDWVKHKLSGGVILVWFNHLGRDIPITQDLLRQYYLKEN
jgi:hypothetical protein